MLVGMQASVTIPSNDRNELSQNDQPSQKSRADLCCELEFRRHDVIILFCGLCDGLYHSCMTVPVELPSEIFSIMQSSSSQRMLIRNEPSSYAYEALCAAF